MNTMTQDANTLTMERRFHASKQLVWEFITRPENVTKWFGHDGWTLESHALDFTGPGPWHAFMRSQEGNTFNVSGEVSEVAAPDHVTFTWAWHDAEGNRGHESKVTFRVEAAGDVTLFTLHHSGLPDAETAASHQGGWTAVLARLERHFPE